MIVSSLSRHNSRRHSTRELQSCSHVRSVGSDLKNLKRLNGSMTLGASREPEWLKLLLKNVTIRGVSDSKTAAVTITNTKLTDIFFAAHKPFLLKGNFHLKETSQGERLGQAIVHLINRDFGSRLSREITLGDIYQKTPLEIKQLLAGNGQIKLSENLPVLRRSCI